MKSDKKNISKLEQKEETPILLLDVNLGNRVERLTLYSGDEERLEEVAQQFAKIHDLDGESESKLVELLQQQI